MRKIKLAPHESFELHELTTFKSLCATKTSAVTKLVQDDELKDLLYHSFSSAQNQLRELADLERQVLEDDSRQGNIQ